MTDQRTLARHNQIKERRHQEEKRTLLFMSGRVASPPGSISVMVDSDDLNEEGLTKSGMTVRYILDKYLKPWVAHLEEQESK